MTKLNLLLCSLVFVLGCNSKETSSPQMCTMLSHDNTLTVEVQLSDELTEGYKILINDKELTSNCAVSNPCMKSRSMEENILRVVLAYSKSESPAKIDFFLIDNTKLIVNRIEKFDVPVKWEEAGLVKDDRDCGVIKKAHLKLTVEGYSVD